MVETSLFAAKSPFRPASPQLKLTQIIANYGAVGAEIFLIFYVSFLNIRLTCRSRWYRFANVSLVRQSLVRQRFRMKSICQCRGSVRHLCRMTWMFIGS